MAVSEEKKDKVRRVALMYYSNPDVQEAIYRFSQNREISPRYYDSFGKRPDSFQYKGDIFQAVKKGATSFHCSEELWRNPLEISTEKTKEQLDKMRIGWDLLIDIDCKWFDYSKLALKSILSVMKSHGVKCFGIKFSGSKGFHIIIPWKSFPKSILGMKTREMFPELPRKILGYVRFMAEKEMKKNLPDDFYEQFKDVKIKRGIKCIDCNEIVNEYELTDFICGNNCQKVQVREQKKILIGSKEKFKCPHCGSLMIKEKIVPYFECSNCGNNSRKNPEKFSRSIEEDLFDLMGLDLILVSSRHLFRMPYSLHEKTAMASAVLEEDEIDSFQPKDANPLKVKIRNFLPDANEGEASSLVTYALDWFREFGEEEEGKREKKDMEFSPVKIENLSESHFPPSIQKILLGMEDGRKRALFILLNFFRAIGIERDELEKRIYDWNDKNKPSMKKGYVKTQITWAYRNKIVPPPNFEKDYYKGIGIIPNEEELRCKNPVNYVVRKTRTNSKDKAKTSKSKDNFKNKKTLQEK
ncbi:hypothetical protein COU59_01145 [Candidatus Pacearchaeota archaeon CG10_big_fil_rev_8_21_14_0_10_34_12]|nr:MAG: hypothetical protein COU59_01145 [Candidatus Pacearchaeota archaeon CG10_big_fil_rev_8_21_14_0_10_34_12]